jgi:protein-S-isoprenylcysteine O-methyltransferase Ste14
MPGTGFWHWFGPLALIVCWGLFALVWLVGAGYNLRKAPAARERTGTVPVWLVAIAAVLALQWVIPASVWRPFTVRAPWLVVAGVVVLVAGTAFTLWARAELGTMWTSAAVVKDDHALRTEGPYALTRHPIYTGLLGMIVGTVLIDGLGASLISLLAVVVIFDMKIRAEERLLDRNLDGAYQQYRRRVPRLLPRPHRR